MTASGESGRREDIRLLIKAMLHIEMASRAAVLQKKLEHAIKSKAGLWVDAVMGDPDQAGELARLILEQVGLEMKRWSDLKFAIVFDVEDHSRLTYSG